MFKGITDYITCMLGGECNADIVETEKLIIQEESPQYDDEQVGLDIDAISDSENSTSRLFTKLSNKNNIDEKEEETVEEEEVEEVDSKSSTPRMNTFFSNKDNIEEENIDDEKEE